MQIYVEERYGSSKPHPIQIRPEDTVRLLKTKIHVATSVPSHELSLIYHGAELNDEMAMKDYGILEMETVYYVRRKDKHIAPDPVSGKPTSMRSPIPPPPPPSVFGYQESSTFSSFDNLNYSPKPPSKRMGRTQSFGSKKVPVSSMNAEKAEVEAKEREAKMREAGYKEYTNSHYIDSSLMPEPPLLSKAEAQERVIFWKDRAREGRFDADTHIVDPQAHYAYIDYLEEAVTTSSEFYRCKGIYGDNDDNLRGWSKQGNTFDFVPGWMWDLLPGELAEPSPKIAVRYATLRNLWKSYYILCRVIKNFNDLSKAGFCDDFYSVLVEHPEKDVAELVKIKIAQLRKFQTDLEGLISLIFSGTVSSSSEHGAIVITSSLAANQELLDALHFSQHQKLNYLSVTHSLLMCRIMVLLLDLGLVSYVGSHGSRFGTYIQSDTESIGFQNYSSAAAYGFTCSLQSLACLHGLLDTRVWVFRSNKHSTDIPAQGLSILTTMDLFADIWGPVWAVQAVPAGYTANNYIGGYILSRGRISFLNVESHIKGAVTCHWSPFLDPNVGNTLATSAEGMGIPPNALLLIGTSLVENSNCMYKLRHYEEDFGHSMGILGTVPETWRLEQRQLGLSLGQYGVLNVAGTQKRLPGVSLKEHIWNKFNLSPNTANIEWLNNYMGVEISHCTGNARRIKLKDLLRLKQVRERLHRCHPHWDMTEWGQQFSIALEAPKFGAMRRLWDEQYGMRGDIARLLSNILQILHHTGDQGDHLVAAYLNRGVDKYVPLKIKANDWAKCLRDSDRMATYALIGDTCLRNASNTPGLCNRLREPTFIELEIMFGKEIPPEGGDIWLVPAGMVLRIVVIEIDQKKIKLVPSTSLLRPRARATQVIESTSHKSRRAFSAVIMASSSSYGGMTERRQRIELTRRRGEQNTVTASAPPVQAPVPALTRTRARGQRPTKQQGSPACCVIL